MKMKKPVNSEQQTAGKKQRFSELKKFLLENADCIQKLATKHHKDYLGDGRFRSEIIEKYVDSTN